MKRDTILDSEMSDGLRLEAIAIVESSILGLLEEESNSDLDWLPEDFGARVATMAWEHQFDIDGTVFRRKLTSYLNDISKQGEA